jgi:hypothetical protein
MFRQLMNKTMQGHVTAGRQLLKLVIKYFPPEDRPPQEFAWMIEGPRDFREVREGPMKKRKYRDGRAHNRAPEQYKFKKGEPSRRKGRKFPKQLSAKELFRKVAAERILIREGDHEFKISRLTACIRTFQRKALGGHMGAKRLYENFREAYPVKSENEPVMIVIQDERDLEI